MAKRGEIDPWNIDVVELADKFLKKVEELDLRFSARVLLYAAILVRMKAEILVSEAIFDEDEEVEEELPEIDLNFELPMEESITIPEIKPRKPRRYTTLQELIRELRKAEMLEVKKRKRRVVKAKAEDVWEVPHEENIEETINRVYEELIREFRLRPVISFLKLTKGFDLSRLISYYLSILHLAYRRKIELVQEKFYEDIKIKPLS